MEEIPPTLADRIHFTDYLANDHRTSDHGEPTESKSFVLTTVSGGSDGHELLHIAVVMRALAGYENIVVTGPQLDDASSEATAMQATPGTQVHRFWSGLDNRIAEAAAMISVGGYNTACETLVTDTPALIVPREALRLE